MKEYLQKISLIALSSTARRRLVDEWYTECIQNGYTG